MSDDLDERALRHSLRADVLSPDALQRIRLATEAQWRASNRQQSRRRWLPLATAASALLAVAAAWTAYRFGSPAGDGAILGTVARLESASLVAVRTLRSDVVLKAGSAIRAGQSLDVRGDALVTLAGGGNLRLARATAFAVLSEHAIKLERGELYVDISPGSRSGAAFVVITPAGEFRHVGTQFSVAIVNGVTRLRVREGLVRRHADDGDSTVNAGTEVVYDRAGNAAPRSFATTGRDWAWAEAMAPDIDIEDRPLLEFLAWFSRETGRKLVLADASARQQASSIHMHGNVQGLTAMEALTAVMASTSLRFELPEGAIRVSSAGESQASR